MKNTMLKLNKTAPLKIEWFIAAALFVFIFLSFCHGDTSSIICYELISADSLLHGNVSNFYKAAYDSGMANGFGKASILVYDLPVNFLLGLWGMPLYLYLKYTGGSFTNTFWQVFYGKSLFLVALIITVILVYRICRALELDEYRAKWGAFLYLTSTLVTNAIGFIGNCDSLGLIFVLTGLLAYIRGENKKFLLWFIIAYPFKQHVIFVFFPLLLLRDKNLLKVALKLLVVLAFAWFCGLPAKNCPEVYSGKLWFGGVMLFRLVQNKIPMLSSGASIFVLLYGALCVYCYLHKEPARQLEKNACTVFVSLASAVTLLSCINSHPQWFLQAAPYLAIAAVFYGKEIKNILLFETLGTSALLFYDFIHWTSCYTPDNARGMLLHKLLGGPEIKDLSGIIKNTGKFLNTMTAKQDIVSYLLKETEGGLCAVYLVCILTVLWLCRPQNIPDGEEIVNIRPWALTRLLVNAAVCSVPVVLIFMAVR